MGLFDFLKTKTTSAETAKNRLQIIIAQERSHRGGPDYLPLLQRVPHPHAVNPDPTLRAHAEQAGWEILDWK